MSQKTVQLILGRVLTDEDFRERFVDHPVRTLVELREQGLGLTEIEIDALLWTDVSVWQRTARRLDARIQQSRPLSPGADTGEGSCGGAARRAWTPLPNDPRRRPD